MDIDVAETMQDGWQVWLDCTRPHFVTTREINTLEADRGRYLGYIRVVGRRRPGAKFEDCWPDAMRSMPVQYSRKPLLRTEQS